MVRALMYELSDICLPEDRYSERLWRNLGEVLNADIEEEANPDKSKPDGVIMVDGGSIQIPCVFLEMKREIGEGGCDPSSQGGLSMRQSWIHREVSYERVDVDKECDWWTDRDRSCGRSAAARRS